MSPWDGLDRAPLRVGLACLGCADAIGLALQIHATAPGPLSHPDAPRFLLALHDHTPALVAVVILAVAALMSFARGRIAVASGLTAVAALAVLAEAHAALVGGPARNYHISGAATLGWVVGLACARLRAGRPTRPARGEDRLAEFAALGVVAATYVNAATSKLLLGGATWGDANHLRAIVVAQHAISDTTWLAGYARAVTEHGGLALALTLLTLGVQFGAVLLLGPPRLRQLAAAGLLAFHCNIFLLTHILYGEAIVVLALFAFPWRRAATVDDSEAAPDRRRAGLAYAAVIAGSVALALLAALPAVRAYTGQHHRRQLVRAAPPAPPEVTALLGGLAPGESLAGLTVAAILGPSDGALHIELVRGESALTLTVVRAGRSPHRPPRSSGGYDLFYGTGAPGAGEVAEEVRDAALEALAARLAASPPPPAGM